MRFPAWIAALTLLCGCNTVVTQAPIFTRADEASAPAVRPGLWRFDGDPDCKADENRPLVEWPKCAGGAVLRGGAAGYYERQSGAPLWTLQPFVLAAGAPRIGQAQLAFGGDVTLDRRPYAYVGARATKFDQAGRILILTFWPVQCGPPPESNQGLGATAKPLPGMVMKPGEPVCTTASADALRAAAKASEAWTPRPLTARWLRDAGP